MGISKKEAKEIENSYRELWGDKAADDYAALTHFQKQALSRIADRNIAKRNEAFAREEKRAKAAAKNTIWTKEFQLFGNSYFGVWELAKGLMAFVIVGIGLIALFGALIETAKSSLGG